MDEDQLLQRIAELERRLDWLYLATGHGYAATNAGVDVTAGSGSASAAVLDLVRKGNKIGAIKQYRDETGVGLKEAKAAVDRLG